jgi:DNA/RNA-binding domain of Phe-tRNA-synthetase-like protein
VKKMRFIVEVFDRYPGAHIGVLTARDIEVVHSDPGLEKMKIEALSVAEEKLGGEPATRHPFIASWREMYRSFGTKPGDYRPSAEALVRRALKTGGLPTINTAVDAYNVVSMRHLIPMGGFDLDRVAGDIRLRFSAGGEEFTPLGSDKTELTYVGEVVYADDERILTRRWNYRDCDETKITTGTRNAVLFADGPEGVPRSAVEEALLDLEGLLRDVCGGDIRAGVAWADENDVALLT